MTFSGTESLARTDDAARRLRNAAQRAQDAIDAIAQVADRIGCRDHAAPCLDVAATSTESVRSLQVLVERKRDELYLASIGMTSEASSMAAETTNMALNLRRLLATPVDTDPPPLDDGTVRGLVTPAEEVSSDGVHALGNLPADQEIDTDGLTDSLEEALLIAGLVAGGKSVDEATLIAKLVARGMSQDDATVVADHVARGMTLEEATLVAELVSRGVELDDAERYALAGDDYASRANAIRVASDPVALATAIAPTIDTTTAEGLVFAAFVFEVIVGPFVHSGLPTLPEVPPGPLTVETLGQLHEWMESARQLDLGPEANALLTRIQGEINAAGEAYRAELLAVVEAGFSEGGDIDAVIDALLPTYAERDESTGEIKFKEAELAAIGLTLDEAEAMYQAALQTQLLEFDDMPDRPPVFDILVDHYMSLGMDRDAAEAAARDVEAGVTDLIDNYAVVTELTTAFKYEGMDPLESIGPGDIEIIVAAYDGLDPENGPKYATLDDYRTRSGVGVTREEYLQGVRDNVDRILELNNIPADEFIEKLRNITERDTDIFKLATAGKQGTALLKLETAEDFNNLQRLGKIDRSAVEAFKLGLYSREYVGLDDIDAIDKIRTGKVDGTLSMDDLVEWLPDSDLPIAVKDILLTGANYGVIDTGGSDRLLDWSEKISYAITAVGAVAFFVNPAVGGGIMTAGGLLGGGTAAGVAIYKGRWGDALVEGGFVLLDLLDGPTDLKRIAQAYRLQQLRKYAELHPDKMDEIAAEIDREIDDVLEGKLVVLDFGDYADLMHRAALYSPDKLPALRLIAREFDGPYGKFKLSPDGYRAVAEGEGADIEYLVANWDSLDVTDSWTLHELTVNNPSISYEDFVVNYNSGLRYDPVKKKMTREGATDTTGWKLKGNLAKAGSSKPAVGYEAHHIVAINNPRASVSRERLKKYEIDINDANNGVWLPRTPSAAIDARLPVGLPHGNLHTKKYYDKINIRLKEAEEKAIAKYGAENTQAIKGALESELDEIRDDLAAGRAP